MPITVLSWREEIERVSTSEAFADATIEIHDPALATGVFDPDTNTYTGSGNTKVAEITGVRAIGIRDDRETPDGGTGDTGATRRMRFAFPFSAYPGRVKRDWHIKITAAPRNPALTGYVYVVDTDDMNSNRASHVVEATVDLEKSVS